MKFQPPFLLTWKPKNKFHAPRGCIFLPPLSFFELLHLYLPKLHNTPGLTAKSPPCRIANWRLKLKSSAREISACSLVSNNIGRKPAKLVNATKMIGLKREVHYFVQADFFTLAFLDVIQQHNTVSSVWMLHHCEAECFIAVISSFRLLYSTWV